MSRKRITPIGISCGAANGAKGSEGPPGAQGERGCAAGPRARAAPWKPNGAGSLRRGAGARQRCPHPLISARVTAARQARTPRPRRSVPVATAAQLRIWLVSQSYLPYHGGITEHVWHLSDALARRGHAVTILTGSPLVPTAERCDADPPGVRVVRLGSTVRIPSHGARACVTLGWNWRGHLAPLRVPRPDLVHLQSPLEPFLPLWMLGKISEPKIGTFHTGGARPHWGYRRFARPLQRLVRRLDARIAVSREAARFARQHFPGTFQIIPNGVDLHRFGSAPRSPLSPSCHGPRPHPGDAAAAPELLYVGRLDPRKGLPVLLDAVELLSARRVARGKAPARLTLVGSGPLRGKLERRARAAGLAVRFAGRVTRADLPGHYATADCFIAPSTDGESFGISPLEALATGLPVVASEISGYAEALQGAPTVRFFRAGDPVALAAALHEMLRLRSAADLWPARAAAARSFALRFDWSRIASLTEALYLRVLARHARSARRLPAASPPSPAPVDAEEAACVESF
ncbi:MAG: glycosyltransferase [Candidatus Eisenbacteria bacterium]|nr:glycosyltransferase [Candidatus Eisenbacteria bacterium]